MFLLAADKYIMSADICPAEVAFTGKAQYVIRNPVYHHLSPMTIAALVEFQGHDRRKRNDPGIHEWGKRRLVSD